MTTIHILEKYPLNTFMWLLNSPDDINRSFSNALEHYEFPFPFNSAVSYKLFEHCKIERTGILTVKTKYGEKHLNELDTATKLALLLAEDFGRELAYRFVELPYLITEPMRWLCENYDLTLYCLYDDDNILSYSPSMTFSEHIKFVHNGEIVPDIINYRIQSCIFTRSKEAQSFEKHFGNKLILKHDHVEQYAAINEEVDIDEYTTPYYFGDLLDELENAEKGKSEKTNSHYAYTAVLSGGVFCGGSITKNTRIYLLSLSYDYVYARLKIYRDYTNANILKQLESIYECGDSDRLTAIIADGDVSAGEFADDYIPHIQYGVEIDFATKTVYILDPTSAAVRFHNALQDSLITDEQHPYIYHC